MSVVIPIVSADGVKSTVTLPDPTVAAAPSSAFPDATNTGPKIATTLWSGSMNFQTDGQVVEGYEFHTNANSVYVPANNVTFRNCKFFYTGAMDENWTMVDNEGTGNLFENCEFNGNKKCARAIWGDGTNVTVRACHIYNTGNAAEIATPALVEECYFHDISDAGTDWHADGVQVWEGSDNLTIRHNTIIMDAISTSACGAVGTDTDKCNNILIENNLLAGAGYTVYTGNAGNNYQVINNHFSTQIYPKVGDFGIWYNDPSPGEVRFGNVIHETGEPCNTNNWGT